MLNRGQIRFGQVFDPDSAILQIMPGLFRAGFNNRLGISGLGQVKIGSDRVRFGPVFDLYEPGLDFYSGRFKMNLRK